MRLALLALLLVACTKQEAPAPPVDAAPPPPPIDAAPPPDAPIAAIPRPPGAAFPCGSETCHAQQYCRKVRAGKGKKSWGTQACAAVPDPCKDSPECACLAKYGVTGTCVDEAGHAVVELSY